VYPLDDEVGSVAATGNIVPAGAVTKAGAFIVYMNNIPSAAFSVAIGDTVAMITAKMTTAIASALDLPMTAVDGVTDVDLTSKWKGASANGITVEVVGPTDTGVTYVVTQPSGGLVNPNIDAALAQIGNVWETMVLNCLNVTDTATLDKFATAGEGRWGALVRKPFMAFSGSTVTSVATAIAIPDARKTDRVNVQLVAPGSKDLPFVVAARQLARIAVLANNNPPHDYGSQQATGLTPGLDSVQWDYAARDQAVKGGSSTVEVRDGVVNVSDVVTFYHPTGDTTPAYRFAVDVVKVMNILFNTDLIFASADWDGAPLIPDDQPTVNRSAKKPKTAVAAVAAMIDSLGLEAIISDPATAKGTIAAEINSMNPKRLDVVYTVALAGNTNIKSIDFNFGFYFGTPSIVA
jgi:phage tail sheath gpL-like